MNWKQIKDRVEYYRVKPSRGVKTITLMIKDFDKISAVVDATVELHYLGINFPDACETERNSRVIAAMCRIKKSVEDLEK